MRFLSRGLGALGNLRRLDSTPSHQCQCAAHVSPWRCCFPWVDHGACHSANEAPTGSSSVEDRLPDLSPVFLLASLARWGVFSLMKIISLEALCAHQMKMRQDFKSAPLSTHPSIKGEGDINKMWNHLKKLLGPRLRIALIKWPHLS